MPRVWFGAICALLLLAAAAPASAGEGVVDRPEFRAVTVGEPMPHVMRDFGTRGRLVAAWTDAAGVRRHRRVFPTIEGRGTRVRIISHRNAAGVYVLDSKWWCVSADFGPTFYCKTRPYPW